MKNFIRERIKTRIKELKIKQKDNPVGGVDHRVYQSHRDSDRVFKIGPQDVVEKWINIFRNNPEYFPKVYRSGQGEKGGTPYYFVEVEKLNTARVVREWKEMTDFMEELEYNSFRISTLFYEAIGGRRVIEDSVIMLQQLIADAQQSNPQMHVLLVKWTDFLKKVKEIAIKGGYKYLDSHSGNYGYDSAGNMKCLDI